ncbi:MAG: hypothetical protein WD492_18225 [Alkalispirochaeta sp.]
MILTCMLSIGCTSSDEPEWRYPGYDATESHAYPATNSLDGEPHYRVVRSLQPGEQPQKLLIADVRGGAAPELVITTNKTLNIHPLHGRRHLQVKLPTGTLEAGFVADLDGDNKGELMLGAGGEQPRVYAMNGAGQVVLKVQVDTERGVYQRTLPLLLTGDTLIAIARPGTAYTPRGVLAFSTGSGVLDWMYSVPFDPCGAIALPDPTGRSRIILHTNLSFQGTYPYLGVQRHEERRADAELHLVEMDTTGSTQRALSIGGPTRAVIGNGTYFLLETGKRTPLLLLREVEPGHVYGDVAYDAALHVVDRVTGEIEESYEVPNGWRVGDVRVLPASEEGGFAVILLVRSDTAPSRLIALDSRLRPLVTREAVKATLGPVLDYDGREATRLVVTTKEGLLIYDRHLHPTGTYPVIEGSSLGSVTAIAYTEYRGSAYVAALGRELHLWHW